MTKFILSAFVLGLGTLILIAEDKKKVDAPPVVGALRPIPLDEVFEKATTEKEIEEALLKSDTYKQALKAALKAKQGAEDAKKKNPNLVGSSPAQAARSRFLAILGGEKDEVEKK